MWASRHKSSCTWSFYDFEGGDVGVTICLQVNGCGHSDWSPNTSGFNFHLMVMFLAIVWLFFDGLVLLSPAKEILLDFGVDIELMKT